MNHGELINKVQNEFSLSKRKSAMIVHFIADEIKKAVLSGESVKIAKFGTFINQAVEERTGVAPTGKKITIPAHNRVKFRPANSFKDEIW